MNQTNRLHDNFWSLCGALMINVILSVGVAFLCRDNAPEQEMTISNPIHLASGDFSIPAKSQVAAQPRSARPEPSPDLPGIPQMPEFSEPDIPPEPVADIEAPELQYEIVPDLLAAKIPEPVQQPKAKPRPKKRRVQKPEPSAKDSATKTATTSPSDSTMSTKTAGTNPGGAAESSSLGDPGSREFGLGEVDRGPQILKQQKPAYPLLARRRNLTGKVTVKFLVDRHGKVHKPKILEAHPKGVFEQSVLDSITKWRFKPGVYKGREVATWVVVPIQFRLTGG